METDGKGRTRKRWLSIADFGLCALAVVSAGCLIAWFWPGSIAFDFSGTLSEAAHHEYGGHQPPSAAVATMILTAGTAKPVILFVIKVVVYFGTLLTFVLIARPPLTIRLGAAVIILSPAFLYLAPLLRSNSMEIVFLGLAIAVGVSARSLGEQAVAVLSFLLAVMFANAPHPGHAALVLLYFLWHFPERTIGRNSRAAAVTMMALLLPILVAYRATGSVDRSPTLYVSALNGIGGLVELGMVPCLDRYVVRGTDASPRQVYADHVDYPHIAPAIWHGNVGFKPPDDLSEQQRKSVIACWRRMAVAEPRLFVRERIALAAITARANDLESQFVFVAEGDSLRFNPDFENGVSLTRGARLLLDYGRFGVEHQSTTFAPYAVILGTTSLLLLLLAPGHRVFALVSLVALIGFCLSQLMMAQAVMFRYYVVPSYVAAWLALLHGWILLRRTVRLPLIHACRTILLGNRHLEPLPFHFAGNDKTNTGSVFAVGSKPMKARGTPNPGATPVRAGTPTRGTIQITPELHRRSNLAGTLLISLAVFQCVFFLLPLALPLHRLVGIALALATLLASRLLRGSPGKGTAVLTGLAVLVVVNFLLHLQATAPNLPFRMWQVAILVGYATVFLSGLTRLTGAVEFPKAVFGWGTAALLLLATEASVGGQADFSSATGKIEWVGATVQDSVFGVRFAPNTVVKSFYPDNPRGYFDEPDALQRRWVLQTHEGSKAQLEFPTDKRGVLRVNINDAPAKVEWHVALTQQPIRVLADERYEVRFRARSDSTRTIFVAVSQAHPPWNGLGLYREVRVDTTWRDYAQTFRATASDRVAQLYFNLGAAIPSVELSNISMRGISSNKAVQAEARRELSVSYRLNSLGCRGPEYPVPANAGTWRILSLGDGNTFGTGVHQGDTYAARLEGLLNESGVGRGPQDHYDVINCGVRGLSTQQERALFASVGPHYSPNVVLLSVSPDDDRFNVEDDRESLASSSGHLRQLFRVWGLIRSLGQQPPRPSDFASIIDGIRQLDADTRARGARLVVVLFQHEVGPNWNSVDSAVTQGLRGSNIAVLNLGPVLLPFGNQKLMVHSTLDRHPNELAHRIAAEALRKFLSDQGMLGGPLSEGALVTDTTASRL